MESGKHSYSVVHNNKKIGRYIARNPSEAAKKALASYFRETGKNPKQLTLVLNNYNDDKIYNYNTDIIEYDKPIIRTIGNKQIKYYYEFLVKRVF